VGRYLAALADQRRPDRDVEELDRATRQAERVLLGLRLDEPLPLAGIEDALDPAAVDRLATLGLLERGADELRLTSRGRFLGGGVTASLVAG
jgi:coproporphyrinogen III oxidase-like Fe-S oxidoreductase